jgi:hypothetical protein
MSEQFKMQSSKWGNFVGRYFRAGGDSSRKRLCFSGQTQGATLHWKSPPGEKEGGNPGN